MTIKSQIEYRCPACERAWLPYAPGLACPFCKRAAPDNEVTAILDEALASAQFNQKLYGKIDVEYWMARRLGDSYLKWGFKAIEMARDNPADAARRIAIAALMQVDLEELSDAREHVAGFLETLIERYRESVKTKPADWEKMPEPENPYRGRGLPRSPEI